MPLNWGDADAAEGLAEQLVELLRKKNMTFDQLASCYSIKYGQSVTQKLKEMSSAGKTLTLKEFISEVSDSKTGESKFTVDAAKGLVSAKDAGAGPGAAATAAAPAPAPPAKAAAAPAAPVAGTMKYSDVSRGLQNLLKEKGKYTPLRELEALFLERFQTSITDVVGMTAEEYLERKANTFDFDADSEMVYLQATLVAGPPMADPGAKMDEAFVVKELESLVEAAGPVTYISTLCGKFIQRNGLSVTSIISTRPIDLLKRYPDTFLLVGAGNVCLKKDENLPEVRKLLDRPSTKAQRTQWAVEETPPPPPEGQVITEDDVVREFRRLILSDQSESVYISSLCGRFLQRFKQPVTAIINSKPADFLRRYPEIFVMTGGGNVGLREVLGEDAVSVPAPPSREPKSRLGADGDEEGGGWHAMPIPLTEQTYEDLHSRIAPRSHYQAVVHQVRSLCEDIEKDCFLALQEVVMGGAAGKGLVTTTAASAEIALFVKQLPTSGFQDWLPHILETMAAVLEHRLNEQNLLSKKSLHGRSGGRRFKIERDCLEFKLATPEGEVQVKVYLSPVFKDQEALLESVRSAPPADRLYYYPALLRERVDFVGRQPQQVKTSIKLIRWWAGRQRWSSAFTTPSDYLLELVVIHAVRLLKKEAKDPDGVGQTETVSSIMELFTKFESIKVLWADVGAATYEMKDIWKPLLSHEPLFMDPVNPYVNLVDPNVFDCRELVALAQQPQCFHQFRKEAQKFRPPLRQEEG